MTQRPSVGLAATAHLHPAPGEGSLCAIPIRTRLLIRIKLSFFFFFKEREKNHRKFTHRIPEQSIHLVEFTLSTTSTGGREGKKNPRVPLKIIYKVKVFTCNHQPYLSKSDAQRRNDGFLSLPPGADPPASLPLPSCSLRRRFPSALSQ